MQVIAIVGAGLMGHGIAQIFAAHGHSVWLVDTVAEMLDSAPERVRSNLTRMAEYGLLDAAEIPEVVARIRTTTDLEQACAQADVVVEAISENLALKQQLFADLDRLCSERAILCSNTSVISITQIGERAARRERILGTHFWNPPYLIPLVEVVQTELTSPSCVDAICDLLRAVGKEPVRVYKDVPGFVGNRLQHALWREAFALIDEGVCDPVTVDIVVRNSFGLRLPVLGPVVNADLVGLDLTLAIHDYILPHLNASPTPSQTLRARVEQKELGFKTGGGFLPWSEDAIASTRERLVTYLLETLSRRTSSNSSLVSGA